MKTFFIVNRMLRITWPTVVKVFKARKTTFVLLLILTIILGTLPTIKSEFESGIINEISRYFNSKENGQRAQTLSELMAQPVELRSGEETGLLEKLAKIIFSSASMGLDILIYFLIIGVTFFIDYESAKIKSLINMDLFTTLREQGFTRMLNKNPCELPSLNNTSGQQAQAIQAGTASVSSVYSYLIDAGQYLIAIATALFLLVTSNPWFAIIFPALLSLHVWVSLAQSRNLKATRNELERERNHLAGYTDEIFSKKEIILANDQGEQYVRKLSNVAKNYGEIDRKLEVKEAIYSGVQSFLTDFQSILLPLLILLFVAGFGISTFKNIGDVYFVISLYTRLSVPVKNLLYRYDSIKRTEATSETFLSVLEERPDENLKGSSAAKAYQGEHAIVFKNVNFKYPENKLTIPKKDQGNEAVASVAIQKKVLSNCSFHVPRNKVTIILGPSGSGKSTIAKLILRFWNHNDGSIFYGDNLIGESDIIKHRLQIGYVAQGMHVVEENLRQNLNWSSTRIAVSDKEVMEAMKKVGLDAYANEYDLEHMAAKDLSGGEAQRLSIARALLDDSPFLILDEPLSGVDIFTIHDLLPVFKSYLQTVSNSRTFLIITHKLMFTTFANHIVVLGKDGQVQEEGAPEELKRRDGPFKKALDLSSEWL